MQQPHKWIWGLIPVALLGVLAGTFRTDPVEQDLAAKANIVAVDQGIDAARVIVQGRDVTISGTRFNEDGSSLINAMEAETGIRLARDETRLVDVAKPYRWSIIRDGGQLSVAGNAPSPDQRGKIMSAVRGMFPGAQFADAMTYARGAGLDFAKLTGLAAAPLAFLEKGSADIVDGRITVKGEAPTVEAYNNAVNAVKAIPAENLAAMEIQLPEVKPYNWSLTRDGDNLSFGGYIPSADLRGKLMTAAKAAFPSGVFNDATSLARGAGDNFEKLTSLAMAPLAFLNKGSAEIVDSKISITGEAPTPEAYRSAVAAALAIPADLVGKMDIQRPEVRPFGFKAERGPGSLVLSGFVPDEKTHESVIDLAKRLFFATAITDKLEEARGAPANFGDAVTTALSQLSRLETGVAELVDGSYKLNGVALYEKAADQINKAAQQALPAGFTGASAVTVKSVEKELDALTCQNMMTGLLGKGRILFETGGSKISGDSTGLLDAVVYIAKSCPAAQIEVSGYTDSDGDDLANLDLSQKRANSVMNYLTDSGIASYRVRAMGYGEARPVATNDTEEGKALNRRIEFVIK